MSWSARNLLFGLLALASVVFLGCGEPVAQPAGESRTQQASSLPPSASKPIQSPATPKAVVPDDGSPPSAAEQSETSQTPSRDTLEGLPIVPIALVF